MAFEPAQAETWLYETLTGDATLTGLVSDRVYRQRIPQLATLPAVVYQLQGGSVLLGNGAVRIWSDLVYLVKAVGEGQSVAALTPILSRVDALLHTASGPVTGGGEIVACVLESELSYDEERDGLIWQHIGGIYRLYVQAS